jgi:hypothetical protein
VVALLINPHVLVHDLAMLLLPVAVAVAQARRGRSGLTPVLLTGYLLMMVGFRSVSIVPVQLSVLALAGLAVWMAARERAASMPRPDTTTRATPTGKESPVRKSWVKGVLL